MRTFWDYGQLYEDMPPDGTVLLCVKSTYKAYTGGRLYTVKNSALNDEWTGDGGQWSRVSLEARPLEDYL